MSSYLYEFPDDYGRPIEEGEGLDYIAETDKTASNVFNGDSTTASELAADLRTFIEASRKLNKHKKVLFRNQSRQEAGFLPWSNPDPTNPVALVSTLFPEAHADLLHGIIGVATESGELCEIAYDQLTSTAGLTHALDVTHVREETGDVLWYLSRLVKWADTTFLSEMKRNVAKLRARHGEAGFSKERDMNRDLDAEHKLLEGGEG